MQIIGHMKCKDTKKCFRWFSDRGIIYHFVDLTQRGLSPKELESITTRHPMEKLIDRDGKTWQERGLAWKVFDAREEILGNPLLLVTPIVREGNKVVVGFKPEEWKILLTT